MTGALGDLRSVEDVFGEGGLLARALRGHEPREAQRAMAELVAEELEHGGVALVEAGTGTGKTFAYLVPALLSGRRVVVSTGTRALQDQIADRDVPALEAVLGERLPVAVLKGLSNYVCLRRHDELLSSAESVSRPEIVKHLPLLQSFVRTSDTGVRGELPEIPEDAPIWSLVESGSDTRIGPRCRFHEACFVTRARKAAEQARVVVVNHHLFFADLALRARGANVIPPYDAVIFDEAHQIADVMTQFFGVSLTPGRFDRIVRDVDRTLAALRLGSELADRLLRATLLRTSDLFEALGRSSAARRSMEGRQSLSLEEREALRDHVFDLEAALEAVSAHLRSAIDPDERGHDALAQAARRIDDLRNDLLVIVEGGHGLVVWLEARGRTRAATLGASPVDVSRVFRDEVLARTRTVVLTSATLSADGSFAYKRRELGVEGEVDELILPSPFDYPSQAALYLPELPDPRDPAFTALAIDEVRALVTASGGGAFVLTTSFRALGELSGALAPALRRAGSTVLVQGELPKHLLLERFRADGHAVLFATQGFWEGVDVPGHALRLVVLDRVPFEVPTDPLVRARCERLEAEDRSAFKDLLLPAAALALKQGFGRLIRTRSDRGVVAILDGRLRTKGYGKVLLRSLPPARPITDRAEVEAFLSEVARASGRK